MNVLLRDPNEFIDITWRHIEEKCYSKRISNTKQQADQTTHLKNTASLIYQVCVPDVLVCYVRHVISKQNMYFQKTPGNYVSAPEQPHNASLSSSMLHKSTGCCHFVNTPSMIRNLFTTNWLTLFFSRNGFRTHFTAWNLDRCSQALVAYFCSWNIKQTL